MLRSIENFTAPKPEIINNQIKESDSKRINLLELEQQIGEQLKEPEIVESRKNEMLSQSMDKNKKSKTAINNLLFNQVNNEEYSFQYYNTLGQNIVNQKEQNLMN